MTAVRIKKREGESINSLIYRFNRRIQQSGVLREAKTRRFNKRSVNRTSRRLSALHRAKRKAEIERQKKLGTFWR